VHGKSTVSRRGRPIRGEKKVQAKITGSRGKEKGGKRLFTSRKRRRKKGLQPSPSEKGKLAGEKKAKGASTTGKREKRHDYQSGEGGGQAVREILF